jgi:hypothetical protein
MILKKLVGAPIPHLIIIGYAYEVRGHDGQQIAFLKLNKVARIAWSIHTGETK